MIRSFEQCICRSENTYHHEDEQEGNGKTNNDPHSLYRCDSSRCHQDIGDTSHDDPDDDLQNARCFFIDADRPLVLMVARAAAMGSAIVANDVKMDTTKATMRTLPKGN